MHKNRVLIISFALLLMLAFVGSTIFAADPGFVDGRFTKTRKITVEIYDRSNPGGSPPEDNFYTDFIKRLARRP